MLQLNRLCPIKSKQCIDKSLAHKLSSRPWLHNSVYKGYGYSSSILNKNINTFLPSSPNPSHISGKEGLVSQEDKHCNKMPCSLSGVVFYPGVLLCSHRAPNADGFLIYL